MWSSCRLLALSSSVRLSSLRMFCSLSVAVCASIRMLRWRIMRLCLFVIVSFSSVSS